jgi:hypothetical protein
MAFNMAKSWDSLFSELNGYLLDHLPGYNKVDHCLEQSGNGRWFAVAIGLGIIRAAFREWEIFWK